MATLYNSTSAPPRKGPGTPSTRWPDLLQGRRQLPTGVGLDLLQAGAEGKAVRLGSRGLEARQVFADRRPSETPCGNRRFLQR
jgi:hypothetical protein